MSRKKKDNLTWLKVLIGIAIVVYVYQNYDFGQRKIDISILDKNTSLNQTLVGSDATLVIPTQSQNVVVSMGQGSSVKQLSSYVDKLSVCRESSDTYESCDKGELHDNNNIYLYWQVINGVGCCSTFNCDYDAFYNACLKDTINLFDIYLDGKIQPWNESFYQYTCEHTTPWNNYEIDNVPVGTHQIMIKQKDCRTVIEAKIITVTIKAQGSNYVVTQHTS